MRLSSPKETLIRRSSSHDPVPGTRQLAVHASRPAPCWCRRGSSRASPDLRQSWVANKADHETSHDTQGRPKVKTSRHDSLKRACLVLFINFRCGRDRSSIRLTRSCSSIRLSAWESACLLRLPRLGFMNDYCATCIQHHGLYIRKNYSYSLFVVWLYLKRNTVGEYPGYSNAVLKNEIKEY